MYISVRLIRHPLIRQFAQFVTSFYPLEKFCSANTSFAVSLLMSEQLECVGIQTIIKDLYLRIVAPHEFVYGSFTPGAKRNPTFHWENVGSLCSLLKI